MKQSDLQEVVQIDTSSFTQPWPANSFIFELMENNTARSWVAEANMTGGDNKVAAMAVCWMVLDEVHIGTFAVHSDFRRHGIGRQLMVHALKSAADEGAARAWLEVRRSNVAAQALYKELGFDFFDTRKKYYQDNGEDALVMTMLL